MQQSYSHPQQQNPNMYVQQGQQQQQMANVFTTMPMQMQPQQQQQHHAHQTGPYVGSPSPAMAGGQPNLAQQQQHHVTTGAQGQQQQQPPAAAMYARPGSGPGQQQQQQAISSGVQGGLGAGSVAQSQSSQSSQDSSMDVVVISSGPPAASRMVDDGGSGASGGGQQSAVQIQQGRTNSVGDQFPPKLPSMVENELLPFRTADLDTFSPMALCTLGKDAVREIFNQSVEFFKILKQIQLAMQQMAGPPGAGSIFRQNLEKQESMQKYISALFTGLSEIAAKVDERFDRLVPKNADAQDLIPFLDEEDKNKAPIGAEKRLKRENIAASPNLLAEHENLKKILEQKRLELDSVMQNLTQMCWDTSLLLLNE